MALAIECGATKSVAVCFEATGNVRNLTFGSANFNLMSQIELETFLQNIKTFLHDVEISEVGIGMPGILTEKDKLSVETTVKKVWIGLHTCWIGNDIETAFSCLDGESKVKIIVIAGTGSNCFGSDADSKLKIGGYGHLLGDRGSSYAIAHTAIRLALREYERSLDLDPPKSGHLNDIPPNNLLLPILNALKLQTISEFVGWSSQATKSELAGLTTIILDSWKSGNPTAKDAVVSNIGELADDCCSLIDKFSKKHGSSVDTPISIQIGLTGSLFTKNVDFAERFKSLVWGKVKPSEASVEFTVLHETVAGALKNLKLVNNSNKSISSINQCIGLEKSDHNTSLSEAELAQKILPVYRGLPQTECRNPRSMNLHTMSVGDAVELMISEEQNIYPEILKQKESIEQLIEKVSTALMSGGLLFYVGAGTSGRLGILDASECPPTFRTQPEMVQGIISGGFSTVSKAKEGAEDVIVDGMDAIKERGVNSKDVVIGIASSGRTPFVWGAMYQAQLLGAFTAFLTFNVRLDMKMKPDLVLAMDIGPEVLTGSTRLKCGSATKCILNMLSTLAMVRMGKCFENLMIDLNPANQKLKQRALRIVLLMTNNLGHITEQMAQEVLVKNKYDIKTTVLELRQST